MLLGCLSGLCSVLVQPVCQWGRRLQHPTRSMSGVGGQQVGWVQVYNHVNITQARSGVLFLRLKEHFRLPSVSSIKQMDPRTRTRVAATLWLNWEWVMGKDPRTPKHPLCFLVNHQWTKTLLHIRADTYGHIRVFGFMSNPVLRHTFAFFWLRLFFVHIWTLLWCCQPVFLHWWSPQSDSLRFLLHFCQFSNALWFNLPISNMWSLE